MTIPQNEYDLAELAILERRLATITDPSRQVDPTPEGEAYRRDLQAHITELRQRCDARQAYDPDDPCHPDYHDTFADAYDAREKLA